VSDLVENFRNPSWWATVVLFGLIVNLLSAYLKPFLDRLPGRLGSSIVRSVEDYNAEVEALRSSSTRQLMTQMLKVEYLIKIIGAFALAVLLFAASSRVASPGQPRYSSVLLVAAVLTGLYSSGCIGRYRRLSDTLRKAWSQPARPTDPDRE
jgi:hypothetical protein